MPKQYADIIICRNVPSLYTYEIPDTTNEIIPGLHVNIPFGRGSAVGIIAKLHSTPPQRTPKPILDLIPKKPIVKQTQLQIIHWMIDHYNTSPYKAYQSVIGAMKTRDVSQPDTIEPKTSHKTLTEDQASALSQIASSITTQDTQTFLLYGVTGSGKTEVYMQAAAECLKMEKSCLMLLPEIALTPQIQTEFTNRFGNGVSVIHSGLTPKQKSIIWNQIYNGYSKIIIGPRSALFTPLDNIGLIMIDEEHEPSYKQENHPRYDTHTLAKKLQTLHQSTLVFGSATPRIESYHQTQLKKSDPDHITLLRLPKRINGSPLPTVKIVDMKHEFIEGHYHPLSRQLISEIKQTLKKKEKIMILINRRGYSSHTICEKCGTIHTCPDCKLSYTLHKDRMFRCHRCNTHSPMTHICQACNKPSLKFGGMGTQKIETEIMKLFPNTNLLRLDKDNFKNHKEMEAILKEFKESGDILIGTQLIAKGHHFEEVTLVGVLGIDTTLNLPDFRSPERTFQLLTQVAGRAGRGTKEGKVVIQTHQPHHYAIHHAQTHDFDGYYQKETEFRQALNYPPFSQLINIIISSTNKSHIQTYAKTLSDYLIETCAKTVQFIGPKPAPFEFIRAHYRYNILIKCQKDECLNIKKLLMSVPTPPKTIRLITDIDPRSIL